MLDIPRREQVVQNSNWHILSSAYPRWNSVALSFFADIGTKKEIPIRECEPKEFPLQLRVLNPEFSTTSVQHLESDFPVTWKSDAHSNSKKKVKQFIEIKTICSCEIDFMDINEECCI
jgi:hypothetical protein